MAGVTLLFCAGVLTIWVIEIAKDERGLTRVILLLVVVALAAVVVRASRVELKVSKETILVRNFFRTEVLKTAEVVSVVALSAHFVGSIVGFRLRDGRVIRSEAVRRKSKDAAAIAAELSALLGLT
jgi:hypothetical protein